MPEGKPWDDASVGRMWDANAPTWTMLARQGFDLYRDLINTPAFLDMLPNVRGLQGLDVGCGEGYNTRLVAQRGARLTALDISPVFIAQAEELERAIPLGIRYLLASGSHIPFTDNSFDFCMSTMCLMDLPDYLGAVSEIYRVLRPGGFLQFSISHPCYMLPDGDWLLDDQGKRIARAVGGYFDPVDGALDEWIFGAAPRELTAKLRKFRIPRFIRTLSGWLNPLLERGFILDQMQEPCASMAVVHQHPKLADSRIVAYFLQIRCHKP
jgi:ubiquinone/menaquinone biosynthesis C-methylase UbiE